MRLIISGVYDQSATPERRDIDEAVFMQLEPGVFRNDLIAVDAFDLRPRLGDISCPALIVCGSADQMAPPKFSYTLHERIPTAELIMIPRAGHMLMVEQPEAVSGAIRSWFISRYRSG